MNESAAEQALRHWGRVYGPPPPLEWQEDSSMGSGALTGCLIEFLRVGIVHGQARGKLTARGRESRGGAKPMKAHPLADRVDHLVCVLYAQDRRAAVALRAQYCLRGSLGDKCMWVATATAARLSRMNFRASVARGKHFVSVALHENKISHGEKIAS